MRTVSFTRFGVIGGCETVVVNVTKVAKNISESFAITNLSVVPLRFATLVPLIVADTPKMSVSGIFSTAMVKGKNTAVSKTVF